MPKHNTIDTVPLESLPERLQSAFDDYFSFVAGVDEDHPADGVAIIWKRPREKLIDLEYYFLLHESDGWHFEIIHPDVVDEYILDKMNSGCEVKKIVLT